MTVGATRIDSSHFNWLTGVKPHILKTVALIIGDLGLRMPKLRLTPLQGQLLIMLSEAGEENLSCIHATLNPTDFEDFEKQVEYLLNSGFVQRSIEQPSGLPSLVLTERGFEAVGT